MFNINDSTIRAAVEAAFKSDTPVYSNRLSFGYFSGGSFIKQHTVIDFLNCAKTQDGTPGGSISMGSAFSAELKAEFNAVEASAASATAATLSTGTPITNYSFKGKVCFAECGIEYAPETFYYIPVGYFYISDVTSDDDYESVSIVGDDYIGSESVMSNPNSNFNLTGVSTVLAALNGICTHFSALGINLKMSNAVNSKASARTLSADDLSKLRALSWRDALAELCGLIGCNAYMTGDGKLRIIFFENSAPAFYIAQNEQLENGFKKLSEENYTILSVTSSDNEGDSSSFTAGSGKGVSFANALITHADITAIYNSVKNQSYRPAEISWFGDARIECGDILYVTYKSHNYSVNVAGLTTDFCGGLSMEISCPEGSNDINFDSDEYASKAELRAQKTSLQEAIAAATAAINGAEGGYVQINDTDNDGNPDEILITQHEGGATGNVIKINSAGIGLSTEGISGQFVTAITGSGINASLITTGTIDAARLLLGTASNNFSSKLTGGGIKFYSSTDYSGTPIGSIEVGTNGTAYQNLLVNASNFFELDINGTPKITVDNVNGLFVNGISSISGVSFDNNSITNINSITATGNIQSASIITGTINAASLTATGAVATTGKVTAAEFGQVTVKSSNTVRVTNEPSGSGVAELMISSGSSRPNLHFGHGDYDGYLYMSSTGRLYWNDNFYIDGSSLSCGNISCTGINLSGNIDCQGITCTGLSAGNGSVTCRGGLNAGSGSIYCGYLESSGPLKGSGLTITGTQLAFGSNLVLSSSSDGSMPSLNCLSISCSGAINGATSLYINTNSEVTVTTRIYQKYNDNYLVGFATSANAAGRPAIYFKANGVSYYLNARTDGHLYWGNTMIA